MKPFLALAALCAATAAQAAPGDYHLVIHGASYHTVQRPKAPFWNQVNPGMGLRYEWTDTVSLQVGAYKNSYYRKSVYGGLDWTPVSFGNVQLGGFLGMASGYAEKAGVAGGGLVRWQGKDFSVALRIVPAKCSIFALELGYRF